MHVCASWGSIAPWRSCQVVKRMPQMAHCPTLRSTNHTTSNAADHSLGVIGSKGLSQPSSTVTLEVHTPQQSHAPPSSLFDLAQRIDALKGDDADKLRRIFRVTSGIASCTVGRELSAKYKMAEDNRQLVVSVTNLWTLEQAWFNEVRSLKPQTFVVGTRPLDPTGGGGTGRCDFCDWQTLTAADPWGRIESEHAVTASNLFKYGEPYHGLALLKGHDPLSFTLDQLSDLMQVSAAWFAAAARHYATALDGRETARGRTDERGVLHPFLLWNALARAGASQFHAHAQLMSTCVPVPAQAQLDLQAERYAAQFPGQDYVCDLLAAHRGAGLLRACAATPDEAAEWQISSAGTDGTGRTRKRRAWVAASLSPIKDMEMLVAVEAGPCHPAQGGPARPNNHPDESQDMASRSGLSDPAFCRALHAALMVLTETMGVESFNVGILSVPCPAASLTGGPWPGEARAAGSGLGDGRTGALRMVLARVVSRGRMSQPASDFGCLEVIGGASIGHTDPFKVIHAVEKQLGACLIDEHLPI